MVSGYVYKANIARTVAVRISRFEKDLKRQRLISANMLEYNK